MNLKAVLPLFIFTSFSSVAIADTYEAAASTWSMNYGKPYLGASYDFHDFKTSSPEAAGNVTSFTVRGGMQFNDYFSAELRVGGGVRDEATDYGTAEIDRYYGGYVRAGAPAWLGQVETAMFRPYVLIGMTDVRFNVGDESFNENGFSYGVGFDFSTNDKFIFNIEFLRAIDLQEIYYEQLSVGFSYQF